MPIVGENTLSIWNYSRSNYIPQIYEFYFPPSNKYIKTSITSIFFTGTTRGAASASIVRVRRRMPDGSEQTIGLRDGTDHYFNHAISTVTFSTNVHECHARFLFTIEHWT